MERQMAKLQKLMDKNWTNTTTQGGKQAFIANLMSIQPIVKKMLAEGKTENEINQYLQKPEAKKYWEIGKGFELRQQSVQDSMISSLVRLHTGILAMNSRSGAIMGYLGGIDYGFSQIDNIKGKNQVGSTFKPITYLTALEQGVDPCTFYDNFLRKYSKYEDWQPKTATARLWIRLNTSNTETRRSRGGLNERKSNKNGHYL